MFNQPSLWATLMAVCSAGENQNANKGYFSPGEAAHTPSTLTTLLELGWENKASIFHQCIPFSLTRLQKKKKILKKKSSSFDASLWTTELMCSPHNCLWNNKSISFFSTARSRVALDYKLWAVSLLISQRYSVCLKRWRDRCTCHLKAFPASFVILHQPIYVLRHVPV